MNKDKKSAEARLENLSVREVSIVDRPANQRRFLLVKRKTGEASGEILELLKTEEQMGRTAIVPSQAEQHGIIIQTQQKNPATVQKSAADFASFLDVLGIVDNDSEDSERSKEDEDGRTSADVESELIPITKDVKQTALGESTKVLEALMSVVNQAKSAGEVSAEIKDKLKKIGEAAKVLASRLGGEQNQESVTPEKGDDISKLTVVLEKLIAIVDKIKKLDDKIEKMPDDVVRELNAISTALAQIFDEEDKKPDERPQKKSSQSAEIEIFTRDIENNDVAIVIKAGSKMSKSRLSSLKKAIEILSSIVKEIESTPADKKGDKKDDKTGDKKDDKKDVKKSEVPPIDESKLIDSVKQVLGEEITKQLKDLGERVNKQFEAIKKRIDDVEDARPAGNADIDPPQEIKKKTSLFSNIIQL